MEVKWIALVAVVALVCSFAMLPAMADEVVEDNGANTDEVGPCCEACGCCGGEKTLGDLLLVGIAMMGLATLSATRK